jgi:hypothetical protein
MSLTQSQRDANTHAHLKAIADAQHKRNNEKHEAVLNAYPWLKGVRDAQKKLNESEAN